MTTLEILLTRTQANLALLAGQGVQLYGEQVILEKLRQAHATYIGMRWWPETMQWAEWTLDGSTGVVTAVVNSGATPLVKFEDIKNIIGPNSKRPLLHLPDHIPPKAVVGTAPEFYYRYNLATKVFKIAPATATGVLSVRYRTRPTTWDLDTEILLDDEMMIRAATFMYLVDDGTNPDATNVAAKAVQDRLNELDLLNVRAEALDEHLEAGGIFEWR